MPRCLVLANGESVSRPWATRTEFASRGQETDGRGLQTSLERDEQWFQTFRYQGATKIEFELLILPRVPESCHIDRRQGAEVRGSFSRGLSPDQGGICCG